MGWCSCLDEPMVGSPEGVNLSFRNSGGASDVLPSQNSSDSTS